MRPRAVSRGKSLQQASLAAKRAARLAAWPAPMPASSISAAVKRLESSLGELLRSNLSNREISAVSSPQRAGWANSIFIHPDEQGQVHGCKAPAQDQRDVAARFLRS